MERWFLSHLLSFLFFAHFLCYSGPSSYFDLYIFSFVYLTSCSQFPLVFIYLISYCLFYFILNFSLVVHFCGIYSIFNIFCNIHFSLTMLNILLHGVFYFWHSLQNLCLQLQVTKLFLVFMTSQFLLTIIRSILFMVNSFCTFRLMWFTC